MSGRAGLNGGCASASVLAPAVSAPAAGAPAVKKSHWTMRRFKRFCAKTSLHGWVYISENHALSWQTGLWSVVLLAVYAAAATFVINNVQQFQNETVRTSVSVKAGSLQEIYFPSLTVCNVNQFESSFMKKLGLGDNFTRMTAIYNEFITGMHPIRRQQEIIKSIEWFKGVDLLYDKPFGYYSHQLCKDLIVKLRYGPVEAAWPELVTERIGPITDGTDYGFCCFITPQVALLERPRKANSSRKPLSAELYHMVIKKGANYGEANGLEVTLDIENFNFAYFRASSQGLRVAVHDHRSKPLMSQSLLVSAGLKTIISINPVLSSTDMDAVNQLKPDRRGCYADGETHLRYFLWEMGYHYDLNNCLFNYGLHRVMTECRCKPFFMPSTSSRLPLDSTLIDLRSTMNASSEVNQNVTLPFCTGTSIRCMYDIMDDIEGAGGKAFVVQRRGNISSAWEKEIIHNFNNVREGQENLTGRDFDSSQVCMPRCDEQGSYIQHSSTKFPQQRQFVYQASFCQLARKILLRACVDRLGRRLLLDITNPDLCRMLEERRQYITNCTRWPFSYFEGKEKGSKEEEAFTKAMQTYASENLAELTLQIKAPSVQTVRRDRAMTFTTFVSNMGGLLGLCLGFSLISFIEFIYLCILSG